MSTSATLCMESLTTTTNTEELSFAEVIARAGLEPAPGEHHLGDQGPDPLVIEDLSRMTAVLKDTGMCGIPPIERFENVG
jgi:hypothetical protein